MKLSKKILPLLMCFSLILTSVGTAFAAETTKEPQTDASGTYLIGTADELFAFAELAKATAEKDKAAGNTRTALSAKLTADINLNPGATFTYDHTTGLVTVAKDGESCIMGSGMKETELGNFHPVYNGLCTWEEWNDETKTQEQLDEYRNTLIAQMNEKVEALGLRKWTPIGTEGVPYIGYFDGDGHTVDGLYINDSTIESTGLIGTAGSLFDLPGEYVSGEIKNLTIGQNSLVVGYRADECGGTGAVVGRVNKYTVSDCTSRALVVGKGNGVAYNINSNVNVADLYGLVGGIAGLTTGKVENCVNYGTVVSRESAGGIVGNLMDYDSWYSSVRYCTNRGSIYAEAEEISGNAGGIAVNTGGRNYRNDYGGLIEACINLGYVEGGIASGIVETAAHGARVKYCANRGKVFASTAASGIVDYIYSFTGSVSVEGSYNAGTVSMLPGSTAQNVYPIARRAFEYSSGGVGTHSVKNCYNDKNICPAEDAALCGAKVDAEKCYSVTTDVFATGEPTYKMGTYNSSGWRQNITAPNAETYPRLDGTELVYYKTHYCCCTVSKYREEHKKYFYTNTGADITDEHDTDESGKCEHCGLDTRTPIFLIDTLPEAKVGKSYSVTIRLSDSAPMVKGNIAATVSETDDTAYTFSHGLSGKAEYSYYNKYYYYISGIPTEVGELTFTLSATNENGTTKKTYTLKINQADPLEIDTEAKLDNGTVGESYWRTLQCYSTDLEKTWSVAEGSFLPEGLTLSKDGTISGKPTQAGDYTFTIVLTVGDQSTTKTFTLRIFEEGGCKHGDKTLIVGTPATCRHDGIADYYHCNICEKDIDEDGNEIWNMNNLKSASNHADKNTDGKCDFCGKNMPIFKKVTSNDGIVYGGTYIFVTKIDEKYYALAIPPEGKYGREYTELMNLCEITQKADGSFDFNELENKSAIMLKTEFAAESGSLDAGTPRYGLSSVFSDKRYGLSDGSACFDMYPNEQAKYGYRITLNETTGAALIGSVYQSWWSTPETADNGLLRAFDMTYNGENTKFMSLYAESYYNGEKANYSGATIKESPIYLYQMTDVGTTSGGITFISNDSNGTVSKTDDVMEILELTADADLSNANGIANAVSQTVVETAIAAVENVSASVSVQICADITAKAATAETDEKGNKTPTSVTYSVTPKITVVGADGNALATSTISDSDLNGAPITVTLHTGGISYPEQIIHYKNDGTKEYFYSEWSDEVQNGAKSFEYDNGFVTFTITEFSDIKILKTAEQEESSGNSLSYDEKTQTLTATVDKDGSYTVVFAGYEKDGKLSYLKTSVQSFKVGTNTFEIPKDVEISKVNKIMLWKDLTSLQPVCGALDITLK